MAQPWWALDDLGELGELDALLSSAAAAEEARHGGAAEATKGEASSGAPLTPSEAAPAACGAPSGGDEVSAPLPGVSGDEARESEPMGDSHQTELGVQEMAEPAVQETSKKPLRCLDERHPASCGRCVAPPDAAALHLFKLTGDPQKKNGEKKLRSLLTRTAEWQDAAARDALAAELEASAMGGVDGAAADAAGTAQLARALRERDCAGLRKQSMVLLARVWGYRADIWQRLPASGPGGGAPGGRASSSSDGDAVGSKRKRERRSRAQPRAAARMGFCPAAVDDDDDDDDAWHAGLARAAGMAPCHVTRRGGPDPAAMMHPGVPYGCVEGPAAGVGRHPAVSLPAPPAAAPSADVARLRELVRCALAPLARDAARAWAGEGARRALGDASSAAAAALCADRLADNAALLRVARKAAAWAGAQHALVRGWRAQLAAGAPDHRAAAAWARLRNGEGPADAVLRALAQLLLAGGADSRAARARDAAAEADVLFSPCDVAAPPLDAAAGAALLTWQAELDGGVADALRWVQGAQRAAASLRAPSAPSVTFADYLEASDVLCELAFAFLTAVAAAFAHRRAWMLSLAGADDTAPQQQAPQRVERLLRLVQQPPAAPRDVAEEAHAAMVDAEARAAAWPDDLVPPPQGRWVVA